MQPNHSEVMFASIAVIYGADVGSRQLFCLLHCPISYCSFFCLCTLPPVLDCIVEFKLN